MSSVQFYNLPYNNAICPNSALIFFKVQYFHIPNFNAIFPTVLPPVLKCCHLHYSTFLPNCHPILMFPTVCIAIFPTILLSFLQCGRYRHVPYYTAIFPTVWTKVGYISIEQKLYFRNRENPLLK